MSTRALPPRAAQWAGLLLPSAAFLANLQVNYVLVTRACRYHATEVLHLVCAVSLACAVAGAVIAWRVWRHAGGDAPARPVARARLLGLLGVGLGVVLSLVIVAQWLAVALISPCQ